MHLKVMMIGMSEGPNLNAGSRRVPALGACLNSARGLVANLEVLMSKTLTVVMGAALVAAFVFGLVMTGAENGDSPSKRLRRTRRGTVPVSAGMMPEVVVRAEVPRLVMPTVEVHAFRAVAMSAPVYYVN